MPLTSWLLILGMVATVGIGLLKPTIPYWLPDDVARAAYFIERHAL